MQVGVVAVNGCLGSALTAVVDILTVAEAVRPTFDASIPPMHVAIAGSRRRVLTGTGFAVPISMGLADMASMDVVVVPALGSMTSAATVEVLESVEGRSLVRALTGVRSTPATLAGACTGVFALAESGVLDDHRATTTWWLGAAFRERYPAVRLDLDAMVVTDAGTVTAGAAFAHVDLALALVRQASPALAEHVARLLVIDERAAQSRYLAVDHLGHDDPLVLALEQHARAHMHEPFDVQAAATAIGTSRRTLERRTRAVLGCSPLELVQRLRIERASHLLRTTGQNVDQIAPLVGYANASTLRTLLRRSARTSSRTEPQRRAPR